MSEREESGDGDRRIEDDRLARLSAEDDAAELREARESYLAVERDLPMEVASTDPVAGKRPAEAT